MSTTRRSFRGIELRDYPRFAWVRITYCREHGHLFGRNTDYCLNCGAPWLFRLVDRP